MTLFGPDPLEEQIETILAGLLRGDSPSRIEVTQVDVKEEPGRRGPGGSILPGDEQNEEAAVYLAEEMACMANTPGGGAIIVGISDDGLRIGTLLDPEWLRKRIWELTRRRLAVSIRPALLEDTRVLVLKADYAVEPVYHGDRIKWRVGESCVEIDPNIWHTEKQKRAGYDWSAQPSGHTLADVDPSALGLARRFLRESPDPTGLADATDEDLIRRLNLVDGAGALTNAGSLLLVEVPGDGLDYIRREVAGTPSIHRVRGGSRPLLTQVYEVEVACQASNRIVHVLRGLVDTQIRAVPSRAFREAMVNGVIHRDWLSPHPTTIEHVGDMITVTSPGGFIGGVDPTNIITHPEVPRYRSLAEAMASLGLGEREGIGIDLMVSEMLAVGLRRPGISEVEGPYVRIGLHGGDPDERTIDFLSSVKPRTPSPDVDLLLLLDHLSHHGWVDASTVSPVLQRSLAEAEPILERLAGSTFDDRPIIRRVAGSSEQPTPAYRLGRPALGELMHRVNLFHGRADRRALVLAWARHRGRVSTTEVRDLISVSQPFAGKLLTEMADSGLLVGNRPNKRGRGFHYLPTGDSQQQLSYDQGAGVPIVDDGSGLEFSPRV